MISLQSQRITLDTMPRTLAQAHEALMKIQPSRQAPPSAWRAFRLLAARVYAEVADIDRFHHHEALYWAGLEREKAAEIAREMGEMPPPSPSVLLWIIPALQWAS